jgi:hypothetical protein
MVSALILTCVHQYLATISRTINAKIVRSRALNALKQVNV